MSPDNECARQEPTGAEEETCSPLRLRWEGDQFVYHSLAYVNRELSRALFATGQVELSLETLEPPQQAVTGNLRYAMLQGLREKPLSGAPDFVVRHEYPPRFTPPAEGHWIMIQPWEFVGLPQSWLTPMQELLDEVWVPTHFVRDGYVQSGLSPDKVHVIPNGVDTQLFKPEGPKAELATAKSFKFLFVGGTLARKGVDLLVTAYLKAFTAQDDVCLVIKDFCANSLYSETNLARFIRECQAQPSAPEILYLNDDLSGDELAALYRSCDALVHPYRGEGFGLPIAEAMACGMPVIVPNYGACLDFCDDETAILVPSTTVSLPDKLGDLQTTIGYSICEVIPDALVRAMQAARQDPTRGKSIGKRASERIHAEFTWEQAAEKALERLKALRHKPICRLDRDFVDPSLYHRGIEPLDLEGRRGFNLLAFPDWGSQTWRNWLEAFLTAFSAAEDVALVLRVATGSDLAQETLLEALASLGTDPTEVADILIVDAPLAYEREGALYTACQALITHSPMTPEARRAAACSLPVLIKPSPEALKAAHQKALQGARP